jgi:hypothetical protein
MITPVYIDSAFTEMPQSHRESIWENIFLDWIYYDVSWRHLSLVKIAGHAELIIGPSHWIESIITCLKASGSD